MNMPKGFPSGYFLSEQEARIELQSWACDISNEHEYNDRCITFDTHPRWKFFLSEVGVEHRSPHAGEWYWYIQSVTLPCGICGLGDIENPCLRCQKILENLPVNPNHGRELLHKIIVHLGREVDD